MKKLLVLVMGLSAVVAARADQRAVDYGQLPARAKEFVTTYFANAKAAGVTQDKEGGSTIYDLYFTDGSRVEFDRRGEWREVDCVRRAIPAGIIPSKIADFFKNNHNGNFAVRIERDKKGYELKLDNGLEVKFDSKYAFTGYDD